MTDVDFVNLALNNLAVDPINVLDRNDSATAAIAIPIYDFALQTLLSAHSWRFATSRVQLSQLTVAPPDTRYSYQYELPGTTFRIVRTSTNDDGWMLYRDAESGYRRLYSNSNEVWVDVVQLPDSSLFPPHFQAAFVAQLTAMLALPLTRRADIKQSMEMVALQAKAAAITQDWNEQPWPELDDGNFLADAKYGGSPAGTVNL